jgi:hypothetical protein
MSNIFDMEPDMSRLSFQEKLLYVQFACALIVGVFYAHFLIHTPPGTHRVHALVIILTLLFVSLRSILRRGSGNVVEDERDRLIDGIGGRWSNFVLSIGIGAMLLMYWDHGALRSPAHTIDLLFHLLLLSAIVRIIRQLIAYRMAI